VSSQDDADHGRKLELATAITDNLGLRLGNVQKQVDQLDTRTNLIVSSSGGLIGVAGVLAALFLVQQQGPRWLLVAFSGSILLFLATVLIAQWAGLRIRQARVSDRVTSNYDVALTQVTLNENVLDLPYTMRAFFDALEVFRMANDRRRTWLERAGVCQLCGVITLGFSAVIFMLSRLS
jgi:hypothetical protein